MVQHPMQPLERCVRDVVRGASGMSTREVIDHVKILMPAKDHEIQRAIECLIDYGDIDYRVDFTLEAHRR